MAAASRLLLTSLAAVAAALAVLMGAGTAPARAAVLTIPDSRLEPLRWNTLAGWSDDDQAAAFATFVASCRAMAKSPPTREEKAAAAALRRICRSALAHRRLSNRHARGFFERHFKPVRIARLAATEGFLTGYYEPVIAGSRTRTPEFTVPVYRRPDDLIAAERVPGMNFANKGSAFRLVDGKRVPYYERGEIEDGALAGKGLEICWLKDPVDAFFMQIQGSARVRLADGATLRLNYAAHNGFPYTPVGRILVDSGAVPKEEMSMDRIRQWMQANPEAGKALRRQNKAFVFFRVADLAEREEAIGAQGIPLTAGRSIAVDRKLHAYGTPFWIDAQLPLTGETTADSFRRLMIAQDTGSAIVGPARADIYFGTGAEAGKIAGRIKQPATFVMLVPKALALTPVRQPAPFPRARPTR